MEQFKTVLAVASTTIFSETNITTTMPTDAATNATAGGGAAYASSTDSNDADDAIWLLTATYIIFTMQTGFGLVEAGCVSHKNEVNIMVKNALDVIFGGISYWLIGYGFSYGEGSGSNAFIGMGDFALDVGENKEKMGPVYLQYVFQLSFATTATTIVSGAMAERCKLSSYTLFSFFNVIVYVVPAHWMWSSNGFLGKMGCVDIAGSGVVHMVGAVAGLVATLLLGPRTGRYDNGPDPPPLGNGTNVVVGTFMLWWAWMGFNCGSTLGVSGGRWHVAAKAAITTLNASVAAGFVGTLVSIVMMRGRYNVSDIVNSVLGGLVSITAPCAIVRPWESLIIGAIGGLLTILGTRMFDRLRIDDPVGAISVHGIAGVWGLLSVGFFGNEDSISGLHNGQIGLLHGGGARSLGVQALAVVCIMAWSAFSTLLLLSMLKATIGLRMSPEEEYIGADYIEHGLGPRATREYNEKIGIVFPARDDLHLAHRSAFGTRKLSTPVPEVHMNVIAEEPDVAESHWERSSTVSTIHTAVTS